MNKQLIRSSVALACSTFLGAAAYAQTSGAGDTAQLEEIVITAQKVESTVQKTPIAIQTLSSDELTKQGIQDAKDLQRLVPGLWVQQTAGGASFYIRGVGTFNESSATDNGLALSLDQMYFSRPYGPDMALYDLQRVEVLKGPQGTLYGRNATGGSINIISKKPELGTFGGNASLEVGSYNATKFNGAVNIPAGDTFAMRLAVMSNKHDGYMKDGYDDADAKAARLHLLWKPSEDTSLLLSGEYMHNGQKGPGTVPYNDHQFLTKDPWDGAGSPFIRNYVNGLTSPNRPGPPPPLANPAASVTAATFANAIYPSDPRSCLPGCVPVNLIAPVVAGPFNTRDNGFADVTVKSLRADLEQNLGFATLSVIPTYLLTDATIFYYNTANPVYTPSKDHQESLEVRLTSPQDQRWTWITGAFYQREKQSYTSFNPGGFPNILSFNVNPDVQDKNWAVFAQSSFNITDSLKATAGIRYSDDRKSTRNQYNGTVLYNPAPLTAGATNQPGGPIFQFKDYFAYGSSASTYRLGLDWQATDQNLVYVSYSTGFHAGGFNGGQPHDPTKPICVFDPSMTSAQLLAIAKSNCDADSTFKPEKLAAYAVGSKNRFLNNTLQINAEVYYWKYTDQQNTSLGLGNPQTTILKIENSGNSTIKGIDADASWLFTANDLVTLNANYNSSKYGKYVVYTFFLPGPFPPSSSLELTGRHFQNAPDLVANLSYQHTFNLSNGGKIIPSVDGKYSSKIIYWFKEGILNAKQDVYQEAYVKYNANLGYEAAEGKWSVNAFVRNIGNKATLVRAVPSPSSGGAWVFLAAPRTYGVNLNAKF